MSVYIMTFNAYAQDENPSMLESFNNQIPGDFSLTMQSIVMGRNKGGSSGNNYQEKASSTSLTFDYISDNYQGLSLGASYVFSRENYSNESPEHHTDPAYSLNLNSFDIMNESYLNYAFENVGLKNTYIRVGRQVVNLNFVRKYNIRHKDQAFEAAIFHFGDMENWKITAGQLEKFSSWAANYSSDGQTLKNDFINIEQVENVSYSTRGFQFSEVSYTGFNNTSLTVYDYYGADLYNTLGLNFDYEFHLGTWDEVLKIRYISQSDLGKFSQNIEAKAYQLGLQLKNNDLSIEAGIFTVTGTGADHNIKSPFQPNLIIEEALYETDLGFEGGSQSYYLESTYSWSDHSLYFLILHTDADESNNTEADIIYNYDISDNLYVKLKFAYGKLQKSIENSNEEWITDHRVFIGYRF